MLIPIGRFDRGLGRYQGVVVLKPAEIVDPWGRSSAKGRDGEHADEQAAPRPGRARRRCARRIRRGRIVVDRRVDTLARTLARIEIPLGVLTSFIGTPFLIWLLATSRLGWR